MRYFCRLFYPLYITASTYTNKLFKKNLFDNIKIYKYKKFKGFRYEIVSLVNSGQNQLSLKIHIRHNITHWPKPYSNTLKLI